MVTNGCTLVIKQSGIRGGMRFLPNQGRAGDDDMTYDRCMKSSR